MKYFILLGLLILLVGCNGNDCSKVTIRETCPECVCQQQTVECNMPEPEIIKESCDYAECYVMLKEAKDFKERVDKLE